MYKDSHINQVSFTTHRHPTEYLRCDIHHVGDMQPQNASSQTETHPHKTHSPSPNPAKEAYSTARNHPRTNRRQIRKTRHPP